jgi:hypothetical protein
MTSRVDDAAVAVAAVAVVMAVALIVWLSWAITSRQALLNAQPAWEHHRATHGAAIRREAEALAAGIRAVLAAGHVADAVVVLKGSVLTGAVRPTSDVDVFVWTKTCEDHDKAASILLDQGARPQGTGGPVTHVHSGGKFTLLTTQTTTGRPADISIAMDPTDTVLPSATHLSTRGFFEFVTRNRHQDSTIRTSHM